VLVATLAQAVVASLVLILLPLWVTARGADQRDKAGWSRPRIAAYFTAIGFAFMFIEIAFIQKFLLFLSHPLYAVAVVLCAFLVFAGLGSSYSGRSGTVGGAFARRVAGPVAGIAILASLYLVVLPALLRPLMPLADGFKILISIGLIAPLAFAMGMPFPMGLARVADRTPPLVPWAWGINACASVVAAIIATLLAIHVGFGAVVLVAVCLYALAAAAYR
jgi:hypothetical protein